MAAGEMTPLRIEFFGEVQPHLVAPFNLHLRYKLFLFDRQYEQAGGVKGSPEFHEDRQGFARAVYKDLMEQYQLVTKLSEVGTDTQYECKNLTDQFIWINTTTELQTPVRPLPEISLPPYDSDNETLQIELFENLDPRYSTIYNTMLYTELKLFDKEYEKYGILGSYEHCYERMRYAKFSSHKLVHEIEQIDNPQLIQVLRKFYCETIGNPIEIEAVSSPLNESTGGQMNLPEHNNN